MNNKNFILKKSKVDVYPDELVVLLHIKENNYLVIHTEYRYNVQDEEYLEPYSIGDYIDFDDCDIEDIEFDITKAQIYNQFLFQEYLKSLNKEKEYKVVIIESERDYGQKIDETKYFYTEDEAKNFVKEYNSKNNLNKTPDWYMYAEYIGKIKIK